MEKKRIEINRDLGNVPPQATDVEGVVLAAMMLERDAISKVDLVPEVFYKEEHQLIFETIQRLDNEGKNIDLITVSTSLKDRGVLEKVGGPGYITGLTRRVASAAHIEQHARILLEQYIRRELITVSSRVMSLSYDTSTDLDDIMRLYETTISEVDNIIIGKHTGRELSSVLSDLNKEIDRRVQLSKEGGLVGIDTGFGTLNKYTAGWQGNWLVIFAARPAMGKTAIAVNRFAKIAAMAGKWVNVFSLEMTDVSLAERLVLGASEIDSYKFKNGDMSDEDWTNYNRAVGELERLPIYIDDSPYVKISHIRNVARMNKRKGKCDMIIIDYLQLADAGVNSINGTREQEVSFMSRSLKALAKELNVPVIVLSQLSRKVEERASKRPVLSDLRESGSIEQDADMVIFPFRPSYYKDKGEKGFDEVKDDEAILIVAKNRHGGTGDIEFYTNESMTDFSDRPFDENPFTHHEPAQKENVQDMPFNSRFDDEYKGGPF